MPIQSVIHLIFAVMRKNTSYSVSTKAPERAEFVYSNSIYKFRFTDLDFVWDFEYMDNPRDIFKSIAISSSAAVTPCLISVKNIITSAIFIAILACSLI